MEQQIKPQGVPSLRLIVGETKAEVRSPAPVDLRELRVTEFLQARSIAANTEKAYRRELGLKSLRVTWRSTKPI